MTPRTAVRKKRLTFLPIPTKRFGRACSSCMAFSSKKVRCRSRASLEVGSDLQLHERAAGTARQVRRRESGHAPSLRGVQAPRLLDQNQVGLLEHYPDIARQFLLVLSHPFRQLGEQAVGIGAERPEQAGDLRSGL